jgi:O-antigen/teichoic acid export membrane protein
MKFARNAMHIALSQVLVGLISYFTVFVGARILDADNLARFSTTWAIINTIALTALIPTETYSPKLRAEFESSGALSKANIESTLLFYCLVGGLLAAVVSAILAALDVLPVNVSELLASVFFVFGASIYGFKRAIAMSHGEYQKYWRLSLNYSLFGSAGLLLVFLMDRNSWSSLFLVLGVASVTTFLVTIDGKKFVPFTLREIRNVITQSRSTGTHKVLGNLLVATFLSLLLSNGAVAFGLRVGVESRDLVSYSAMLNIVLIPMMMLNSFSAPTLNKAVELIHSHQIRNFTSLYVKAMSLYLGATILVVFVSVGFGNYLLHVYVGASYDVSPRVAGAIALSEGLATLTVLPRLFLVASGATTSILRIWMIGVFCFVGILVTPVSPLTRIVIAPGIAGGVIVLLSSIVLLKNLKLDSSFAISPTGDTSV